ncbi:MAG: low molecular weight phosphotyrosine protein phosphatase [Burkholderiales bacterium]|nr:MAG: low molecular weight phosphotyrosine protein phosphatase [Burkholderiales bacterium]
MNKILVVCVGNICRSPVAEGLLKAALPDAEVWSAGLGALVGNPADPMAAGIAKDHGIDISEHRAQQIAGWMLVKADLVLCMEAGHQRELQKQYPTARGKIRRLGDFGAGGAFDVADPYRQTRAAFETAHANISRGVNDWVHRIKQLA